MTLTPFATVLVANRGEIACRVIRAVQATGRRAVAVYTDVEAHAPHVRMADSAVRIGTGPVADSYLVPARLIAAAQEMGADAVHPGYGFLSESAEFAQACGDAGLLFIGPSAHTIAAMGNKAAAKTRMQDAQVPCVPGYEGADQSDATLAREAARIGFPIMLKAAAGGGGRGMRVVERDKDFADHLHAARAEALAAFGSDQMILERAITDARHVEVQVLADRSGHTVHLGERDCSLQRRHQKVIEEAPAPGLDADLRARMGAAAVAAAQAIGYEGAGTVEFLLDGQGGFYFLEMNTRLQVEHPVTEAVTGCDLVALQLHIATGAPLGVDQSEVTLTGHAIEARLYAEDPAHGFLPQTGTVLAWSPASGPGIRVDHGLDKGSVVSPFYDPLLAKIIAHGPTREAARQRLIAALEDTVVFGVVTNRDALITLLNTDCFAQACMTTAFIDTTWSDGIPAPLARQDVALGSALWWRGQSDAMRARAVAVPDALVGWSSSGRQCMSLRLSDGTGAHTVTVKTRDGTQLEVMVKDTTFPTTGTGGDGYISIDGTRCHLRAHLRHGDTHWIATPDRIFALTRQRADTGVSETANEGRITAPLHGTLTALHVTDGDRVEVGSPLVVIEAMKMQHQITAQTAGIVQLGPIKTGQQVAAGTHLMDILPD